MDISDRDSDKAEYVAIHFFYIELFSKRFCCAFKILYLKIKYSVLKNITLGTFEDFFNTRWFFFTNNQQGTLLNTFTRELEVVGNSFGAISLLFAQIVQLSFYLIVPLVISWEVTLISIACATIFVTPFLFLGSISRKLGVLSTSTSNQLMAVLNESFNVAKVILGFGNQKKSIRFLSNAFDAHVKVAIKSQTLGHAQPLVYFPFGIAVMAIAVYTGQKLNVALSEMSVILFALIRILPNIGNLVAGKNALHNFFPSYEQILRLKDLSIQSKQPSGTRKFDGFNQNIAINELTYAYPDRDSTLIDINIRIPKGKMIAFVGESGVGKSTLIDIIMGFNEPSKGQILIDGLPLQDFNIISYRKKIGYVPQDSILFNMSITDNLLWAKSEASRKEIYSACKLANAHDFIQELPEKYDTTVGDRGVLLSGGQIQRIALARAILRKPELLILDEATSSLDTQSERLIQEAIDQIAKRTTVVAVAHRLSTILQSDYIYVLQSGSIVEEGKYDQLMRNDKFFKKMVQAQSIS